jgi:hypothetical protein
MYSEKYDKLYVKSDEEMSAYIHKTGAKYKGQTKDGFMQGRGVMKWLDGSRYEGYWDKDKATGHGRMIIIGKYQNQSSISHIKIYLES